MSESSPVIALGAVIAIAALGGVLFLGRSAPEPSADLVARLESLETEVAALRAEVARRPDRRSRRGPPGGGARAAARDGGERASSAVAREDGTTTEAVIEALDSGDPAVEETIGGLVRDQLDQEREQRMDRRRERMVERTAKQLAQLAIDADLDDAQVADLEEAITEERDAIFAIFRAAREDGSWDEAREKADAIRLATDEDVAGTLNTSQREAWTTYREEETARRR